jgi:hypothetical protein
MTLDPERQGWNLPPRFRRHRLDLALHLHHLHPALLWDRGVRARDLRNDVSIFFTRKTSEYYALEVDETANLKKYSV